MAEEGVKVAICAPSHIVVHSCLFGEALISQNQKPKGAQHASSVGTAPGAAVVDHISFNRLLRGLLRYLKLHAYVQLLHIPLI